MSVPTQLKRGKRSALDAAAVRGAFLTGEPLFITDEDRLAVATSETSYVSFPRGQEITDIVSDDILHPHEKPAVVQEYGVLAAELAVISAAAVTAGVTTEAVAYSAAVSALTSYLGTLSGWDVVPGANVGIDGDTFRAMFSAVYTARGDLREKISEANAIADATAKANAAQANAIDSAAADATAKANAAATTANWAGLGEVPSNISTAAASPGTSLLNSNITMSNTGMLSGGGGGSLTTLPTLDNDREGNPAPSAFTVGTTKQFKLASAIGLSAVHGHWATLETIIQYASGGGGFPGYQYAYQQEKTWRRRSADDAGTAWTAWVQDLDTATYTGALNANYTTNTNQLTDGAGLGTTANWTGVSNPPAGIFNSNITVNANGTLTGAGAGQVTLPGMGANTYRVVTWGNAASTQPSVTQGLHINNTHLVGAGRSYVVGSINRITGDYIGVGTYDVYVSGAEAARMATDLNTLDSTRIVIVWSCDEPQNNRLSGGLAEAMYRHGASRAVFGSPSFRFRSAYILVGVGGCGEGNGAEIYQGAVDNDPNAWADIGFSIINGVLTGVSTTTTPKSLQDYGYTGDLNASSDITLIGRGGVTVSGNTVTLTSGAAWVSDAYSKEGFAGGAWASATSKSMSGSLMFGLNTDPSADGGYPNIDYAIYLQRDGAWYAWESGNSAGQQGTFVVGDTFAVTYDGVRIQYSKNGVSTGYRSVAVAITAPLYFDSSFAEVGGAISNVRVGPMSSNIWDAIGSRPSDSELLNSYATIGQNLLPNSDQSSAMTWANSGSATGSFALQYASNFWADTYTISSGSTRNLVIHQWARIPGDDYAIAYDIYPMGVWSPVTTGIPVVVGQRYCFSAYLNTHRCFSGVGVCFFDAGGNLVQGNEAVAADTSGGSCDSLSLYHRVSAFAVAPAGAALAMVYIRKFNTFSTAEDSYLWMAAPQFEAVNANTQGPSPYTAGPVKDARQLGYTGALNATANALTSGPLANRPAGADGDTYFAIDTLVLYQKIAGAWTASATNTTNTSQLTDGAGLGSKANSDGSVRTPGGGTFVSTQGTLAGAITVTLPQFFTNTMVSFIVDIYEYAAGYSCSLQIGGHSYESQSWHNVSASVIGGNVEYPVYFGHDGSKCKVWIGNYGSESWVYPQVRVRDVLMGYSNYGKSLWEAGWVVGVSDAAPTGVTAQVLDTYPAANWAKVAGAGKPADNATNGATIGVNVGGSIPANSSLIGGLAIGTGQIALNATSNWVEAHLHGNTPIARFVEPAVAEISVSISGVGSKILLTANCRILNNSSRSIQFLVGIGTIESVGTFGGGYQTVPPYSRSMVTTQAVWNVGSAQTYGFKLVVCHFETDSPLCILEDRALNAVELRR